MYDAQQWLRCTGRGRGDAGDVVLSEIRILKLLELSYKMGRECLSSVIIYALLMCGLLLAGNEEIIERRRSQWNHRPCLKQPRSDPINITGGW